jgi:hypothetical protein
MDDTKWPVPTSDYKLLLRDGAGPKVAASGSRLTSISRYLPLPAQGQVGKSFD